MTDSGKPCCSNLKAVAWTLALFALFGFLGLILTGQISMMSPEDRAYMGEFSDERTTERWANLEEVSGAQASLLDQEKVDAALAELAKAPAKPTASEFVVPGSPTFMKQSEEAAESEDPAEDKSDKPAKDEEKKSDEPAKAEEKKSDEPAKAEEKKSDEPAKAEEKPAPDQN